MRKNIILICLIFLISISFVNANVETINQGDSTEIIESMEDSNCNIKWELSDYSPIGYVGSTTPQGLISIYGLYDNKYLIYLYRDSKGEYNVIYNLEENKVLSLLPDDYFIKKGGSIFLLENTNRDKVLAVVNEDGSRGWVEIRKFYYYDFVNKKPIFLVDSNRLFKFQKGTSLLEDVYMLSDLSLLYGLEKSSSYIKDDIQIIEGLGTELWKYDFYSGNKILIKEFEPKLITRTICKEFKDGECTIEGIVTTKESPTISFFKGNNNDVIISINYGTGGEHSISSSEFWIYENNNLRRLENIPSDLGYLKSIEDRYMVFVKPVEGEIHVTEELQSVEGSQESPLQGIIESERADYGIISVVDLYTGSLIYNTKALEASYIGNNKLAYSESRLIFILDKFLPINLLERYLSPHFILYDLKSSKEFKIPVENTKGLPSMASYKNKLIFTEPTGEKFTKQPKEGIMSIGGGEIIHRLYSCTL